jgi:hypothetical protein
MFGAINPYVGIQVRRTDKLGKEAGFHTVEEYMKYVEEYFEFLEVKEKRKLHPKRVYVASDDPIVLEECRRKYPGLKNISIFFLFILNYCTCYAWRCPGFMINT